MKTIKIPTNKEKFYRQVLEVLKSFPPFTSLRPKELDVLGQFMKYNEIHSNLDIYSKGALFSSAQFKKMLREEISMSEDSFNNNISRLRKLKLISSNNTLHKFIDDIKYSNGYEIKFIFKLNESTGK